MLLLPHQNVTIFLCFSLKYKYRVHYNILHGFPQGNVVKDTCIMCGVTLVNIDHTKNNRPSRQEI